MRHLLVVTMCIGLLNTAGLPVHAETGGGGRREHPVAQKADAATLAEIDAAAKLTFNSSREQTFVQIASRPNLSAQAQTYLVINGVPSLTFDSSRLNVMLALVTNPHFLAEGKTAVLEHLELLTFNSSRNKVLEAVNQRGHIPSEREMMQKHPFGRLSDTATLAEIDAAIQLAFNAPREEALLNIASRPYLSAQAQTYLVTNGVPSLTFDSSRLKVMLALVTNPHFLAEGKQAVLEHLELLTFDSSRKKVLESINLRSIVHPNATFTEINYSPFLRFSASLKIQWTTE